MEKLRALDAQVTGLGLPLGGSAAGDVTLRRTRPRNVMNLVETLEKALNGETLSVTDVVEAVERQGYHTTSPNFRTIVIKR